MTKINMTVDGVNYSDEVEPRTLLVHYLRETLGKVGTVVGCDTSNCGACTVDIDGRSAKSCTVLAVQADGSEVTTIEGLAGDDGELHAVQQAFHECHALQCGFCTPGMIMAVRDLLKDNPRPLRAGGPGGHRGQPVPLHRLPEHRQGGSVRGWSDEVTAVEERISEIGQSRRRKEDGHLITGRTTWTDNSPCPGMLHVAFLRSPMAHAKLGPIDVSEAKGRPGVVGVFTGQDFKDVQGSLPCAWAPDGLVNPGTPSIAVDQVNYAGEIVAVVVARSRTAAQDAIEGIDVDFDPLPAVVDMEAAVADGADLVHPTTESNLIYRWEFESGAAGTGAPIQEALDTAEVTVQPTVHPAAADPGVHGTALDGGAAGQRRCHDVELDPDPPHPADPARRRARHR